MSRKTRLRTGNLHDVRNPPNGFLDWAIDTMKAVSIESEVEWEWWKNHDSIIRRDP